MEMKKEYPDKKINNGAARDEIILNQIECGETRMYGHELAIIIMMIAIDLNTSILGNLLFCIFNKNTK